MRISYRLTLIVLLMTTLPLAIIGYLATDLSRNAIEQAARKHLIMTNLDKKMAIQRWLNSASFQCVTMTSVWLYAKKSSRVTVGGFELKRRPEVGQRSISHSQRWSDRW